MGAQTGSNQIFTNILGSMSSQLHGERLRPVSGMSGCPVGTPSISSRSWFRRGQRLSPVLGLPQGWGREGLGLRVVQLLGPPPEGEAGAGVGTGGVCAEPRKEAGSGPRRACAEPRRRGWAGPGEPVLSPHPCRWRAAARPAVITKDFCMVFCTRCQAACLALRPQPVRQWKPAGLGEVSPTRSSLAVSLGPAGGLSHGGDTDVVLWGRRELGSACQVQQEGLCVHSRLPWVVLGDPFLPSGSGALSAGQGEH